MASSSSVYVGHLSYRTSERDIEDFFRNYGRIRDIIMKNGFAFVKFDDARDAEDAINEGNGRDLGGSRIVVELCRGTPRSSDSDRDRRGSYRGSGDFRGSRSTRGPSNRYGPPVQTRNRLAVENLSTRCSWQDLKDLMRSAGEVTYADAHKKERNTAVVCFAHHDDLKRAIEKFQGKDINGRRIKLIDESGGGSSRSRSRSPRPRSRSQRSRTPRSRSPRSRSRSPLPKRTRSNSPMGNGRSISRTPSPNGRSAVVKKESP